AADAAGVRTHSAGRLRDAAGGRADPTAAGRLGLTDPDAGNHSAEAARTAARGRDVPPARRLREAARRHGEAAWGTDARAARNREPAGGHAAARTRDVRRHSAAGRGLREARGSAERTARGDAARSREPAPTAAG